ncbi:MAG: hypothetical protein KGL67_02690 [Patescibacteria group bacterium]|nr:hypothetical protein [Patescibacteria group bacterium]
MAKNLFQDMVKAKRTQREIPQKEILKKEISRKEIPTYPNVQEFRQQDRKNSHSGLWFIALISIAFFVFALSFFFAKAQVTVNPKIQDFPLNENLSAIKDINPDGLAFDLVIISGDETEQVPAGAEQDVSINAKGSVFIYNTFSSVPQKLSINTKLEGSNGKIYETTASAIVPGVNTDGTPGKVAVDIQGAQAGAEYNSDPIDFKILGFKGTAKYDKFYGRSNGSINGGFKGKSPVISDVDKENAFAQLQTVLQTKLFQKAIDQIPNGFVLFKNAAFLNIDSENVEFAPGGGTLPVTVKGTLYGFLFNEKSLTQKIAKDVISNYDGSEVYIPNIKDLVFSLPAGQTSPVDQGTSFSDIQNINFNLSGSAKIVWKFDDAKFGEDLLGKSKSDFNQILSQYPNVDSAQLVLSPFWIRSLPSKLKDIKVLVNYPK